jgi:hypothetical protein
MHTLSLWKIPMRLRTLPLCLHGVRDCTAGRLGTIAEA